MFLQKKHLDDLDVRYVPVPKSECLVSGLFNAFFDFPSSFFKRN